MVGVAFICVMFRIPFYKLQQMSTYFVLIDSQSKPCPILSDLKCKATSKSNPTSSLLQLNEIEVLSASPLVFLLEALLKIVMIDIILFDLVALFL